MKFKMYERKQMAVFKNVQMEFIIDVLLLEMDKYKMAGGFVLFLGMNGFEFNLMVVGCSGLGKSTFVNSLLISDIYNNKNMTKKYLFVNGF